MSPTKEPTETQRALASRMQHLFNAGNPKHVEAEAVRLIVEHDAALEQQASSYAEQTALAITQRDAATARAEAAESLVIKGKSAVNAAVLYMAMDSDSEDFDEAQFHRLRDEAQEFLALTPDSMVSKLADALETAKRCDLGFKLERKRAQVAEEKISELMAELSTTAARLAEQDAELARLREENGLAQKERNAIRWAVVDTVKGIVEGRPTAPHNYLQRLRELVKAEQRAERLADALRDLLFAHENADETGYVTDVGFLKLDDITAKARAALADQPAQANTREAALIAAGDAIRDHLHLWKHADGWTMEDDNCLSAWDAAKQGAQPVENAALLSVLSPSDLTRKLTADKAAFCMQRDGSEATGFILTDPKGGVGIVNQSAVRWLSVEEFRGVMGDELAALREDRARLDWWYHHKNAGRIHYGVNGVDAWFVDGRMHQPFENPRAAIDAARKTEGAS